MRGGRTLVVLMEKTERIIRSIAVGGLGGRDMIRGVMGLAIDRGWNRYGTDGAARDMPVAYAGRGERG